MSEEEDINKDSDDDNLTDIEEKIIGTDPNNPDTDNDGYNDYEEVMNGYNPLGSGKIENPLEDYIIARDIDNRDNRRISDIKSIQTGLELYYVDNNSYPLGTNLMLGSGSDCNNDTCDTINSNGISDTTTRSNTTYMGIIYPDPANTNTKCTKNSQKICNYSYTQTEQGQNYQLYFYTETDVKNTSAGPHCANNKGLDGNSGTEAICK